MKALDYRIELKHTDVVPRRGGRGGGGFGTEPQAQTCEPISTWIGSRGIIEYERSTWMGSRGIIEYERWMRIASYVAS